MEGRVWLFWWGGMRREGGGGVEDIISGVGGKGFFYEVGFCTDWSGAD